MKKTNIKLLSSVNTEAKSVTGAKQSNNYATNISSKLKPAVVYHNADEQKELILNDNKGKSGVYRWINLDNNKCYVGSGVNLSKRLASYFSDKNLKTQLERGESVIYKAILRYSRSKFKLEILEYCEHKDLLMRETYYIILLNPEYNILKEAGSRLGSKHSKVAIDKIQKAALNRTDEQLAQHREWLAKAWASNIGRTFAHSEESKEKIRIASSNKTAEHILKYRAARGTAVVLTKIETNETTEYLSINEAAKVVGVSPVTLGRYIKKAEILKGYIVNYKVNPKKFINLKAERAQDTPEGLQKMKDIKAFMNKGRKD